MSHIAVDEIEDGLHPSELVVTIRTAEGRTEEVAVDRQLVSDRRLKVYTVEADRDRVLVELPRETLSGSWRVWMPKASVFVSEQATA